MPLFASSKDASFLRHINKELLHRVIGNDVELYKVSLDDTPINIYSEAPIKRYYNPIKICALIQHDPNVSEDGDQAIDKSKTATFAFLRDDLKLLPYVIEKGDVIGWDNSYFEIDNIRDSQYWMGRNNETLLANEENQLSDYYGYSVSIVVETHLSRESSLQLTDTNFGIPKTQNNFIVPRNL